MNMKALALSFAALLLFACHIPKPEPTPAQQLIDQLTAAKGKGILFAHQDDLAYGVDWWMQPDSSDVKAVAGDFPAICGWELGGIERGDARNLDSVLFTDMRDLAIKFHQMGGINSFSWHGHSPINNVNSWNTETRVVEHIIPGGSHHEQFKAQLDKVADFFGSLKDENGKLIPVIYRPWHEMGGSWFWWGRTHCSTDDYKALFRFTVEYFRQKGLTNLLIHYSPDGGFATDEEYLTFYPGDDVVDMLGMDDYDFDGKPEWIENVSTKLRVVIKLANQKHKLSAFAETGREFLKDSLWFTNRLAKAIEPADIQSQISYVLIWRNDPRVHHYFSFPGHPSEADARQFLNQPWVLLLNDWNAIKNK